MTRDALLVEADCHISSAADDVGARPQPHLPVRQEQPKAGVFPGIGIAATVADFAGPGRTGPRRKGMRTPGLLDRTRLARSSTFRVGEELFKGVREIAGGLK